MGIRKRDLTQQRQREFEGLPPYHRPKHQAKQTRTGRCKIPARNSPRKETGSSSKDLTKRVEDRDSKKSQQMGGGQRQLITPGNKEINSSIPHGSNVYIHKAKAIIIKLV